MYYHIAMSNFAAKLIANYLIDRYGKITSCSWLSNSRNNNNFSGRAATRVAQNYYASTSLIIVFFLITWLVVHACHFIVNRCHLFFFLSHSHSMCIQCTTIIIRSPEIKIDPPADQILTNWPSISPGCRTHSSEPREITDRERKSEIVIKIYLIYKVSSP